jgi:antitoxin component HigA of HigAB toxin-antitoxin module
MLLRLIKSAQAEASLMQVFDNVNRIVKDDLEVAIGKGSRLSIAAACFSIYAYQALKKQLDGIEELRFIFTSPAFVTEKAPERKTRVLYPTLES